MMPIDANPFILFMPSHLLTVAISVFLFIYIPFRIRKNTKADWVGYFCKILGILLIGNELGWVIYKFNMVGGGWAEYMPFELCTINAYLLGFLLIFRPTYAVFEVLYFFSMAGTVQGIITPRLFAAFPHYCFGNTLSRIRELYWVLWFSYFVITGRLPGYLSGGHSSGYR